VLQQWIKLDELVIMQDNSKRLSRKEKPKKKKKLDAEPRNWRENPNWCVSFC
jgi:hypothetical protein